MANKEKTLEQGLTEGKFTAGQAAYSFAPVPLTLYLNEVCAGKRSNGEWRVEKEQRRYNTRQRFCILY